MKRNISLLLIIIFIMSALFIGGIQAGPFVPPPPEEDKTKLMKKVTDESESRHQALRWTVDSVASSAPIQAGIVGWKIILGYDWDEKGKKLMDPRITMFIPATPTFKAEKKIYDLPMLTEYNNVKPGVTLLEALEKSIPAGKEEEYLTLLANGCVISADAKVQKFKYNNITKKGTPVLPPVYAECVEDIDKNFSEFTEKWKNITRTQYFGWHYDLDPEIKDPIDLVAEDFKVTAITSEVNGLQLIEEYDVEFIMRNVGGSIQENVPYAIYCKGDPNVILHQGVISASKTSPWGANEVRKMPLKKVSLRGKYPESSVVPTAVVNMSYPEMVKFWGINLDDAAFVSGMLEICAVVNPPAENIVPVDNHAVIEGSEDAKVDKFKKENVYKNNMIKKNVALRTITSGTKIQNQISVLLDIDTFQTGFYNRMLETRGQSLKDFYISRFSNEINECQNEVNKPLMNNIPDNDLKNILSKYDGYAGKKEVFNKKFIKSGYGFGVNTIFRVPRPVLLSDTNLSEVWYVEEFTNEDIDETDVLVWIHPTENPFKETSLRAQEHDIELINRNKQSQDQSDRENYNWNIMKGFVDKYIDNVFAWITGNNGAQTNKYYNPVGSSTLDQKIQYKKRY